jgi:hypothetical protein
MYDCQQVSRPFNKTGERCPSHFAHVARLARVKGIKIQRLEKSIFMEVLHALYANMTQTAMLHVHGIIITKFASHSIHTIDM